MAKSTEDNDEELNFALAMSLLENEIRNSKSEEEQEAEITLARAISMNDIAFNIQPQHPLQSGTGLENIEEGATGPDTSEIYVNDVLTKTFIRDLRIYTDEGATGGGQLQQSSSTQQNTGSQSNQVDRECIICTEDIESHHLHVLPCAHKFHDQCVQKWFETTRVCPVCRTSIEDPRILVEPSAPLEPSAPPVLQLSQEPRPGRPIIPVRADGRSVLLPVQPPPHQQPQTTQQPQATRQSRTTRPPPPRPPPPPPTRNKRTLNCTIL